MIKTYTQWLPVVLWIGFIFLMSTGTFSAQHTSRIIEPILRFLLPSISQEHLNVIHFFIRKAMHGTEYCVLGLLLFRFFRNTSDDNNVWRWAFLSFIIVVVVASADEFHQSFISVRTASIIDVGIDCVGGMIAQVICIVNGTRQQRSMANYIVKK